MNLMAVQLNTTGTSGTLELVPYNCNAESGAVALGAITDAITMAKLVQSVWNLPEYEPILRKYMGERCVASETWRNGIQSESRLNPRKDDTHCQQGPCITWLTWRPLQ